MISLLEWGKVLINLIALNSFAFISKTVSSKSLLISPPNNSYNMKYFLALYNKKMVDDSLKNDRIIWFLKRLHLRQKICVE